MLEVPPFIPPLRPEQEPSIRVLSGPQLAREVRKQDAVSRAMLAAELSAGRIVLEKLTPKQAQQLAHSSYGYAYAARQLSPLERSAVRSEQLKLADVARRRHKPLTDANLDQLVQEIGADRVFGALDRITAPGQLRASPTGGAAFVSLSGADRDGKASAPQAKGKIKWT